MGLHKYTVGIDKAMEVIDLYIEGYYSQSMVADLCGISTGTVWRILTFQQSYACLLEMIPAEKLEKLEQVKRERRHCGGASKLTPSRVRRLRRALEAGGYGERQELAAAFGITPTALYMIEHRLAHDY